MTSIALAPIPFLFSAGDRVRVRKAYPPGHIRTPTYIRGCPGVVVMVVDSFPNPEETAYGRTKGPEVPLYRVRFRQTDIWPRYHGGTRDTVDVEIYQHWLEPDEAPHA